VLREARGREVRQGAAALRYCCAIPFLEVYEFQKLPHGAITPQYVKKNPATQKETSRLLGWLLSLCVKINLGILFEPIRGRCVLGSFLMGYKFIILWN
jgi:hypothetical protein